MGTEGHRANRQTAIHPLCSVPPGGGSAATPPPEPGLARRLEEGTLGALLMSPVWDACDLLDLAEWSLEDHLPVRLQTQLHKHIWEPDARGV